MHKKQNLFLLLPLTRIDPKLTGKVASTLIGTPSSLDCGLAIFVGKNSNLHFERHLRIMAPKPQNPNLMRNFVNSIYNNFCKNVR
jgi:hypothetical protein